MIPQDFSWQLPARCARLIEELEHGLPEMDGGHLRTTFLLSMAMPLLTIPHQVLIGNNRLVMRDVNRLRRDIAPVMQAPFGEAPFRANDTWYYLPLADRPDHPFAITPNDRGLRDAGYGEAAEALPTSTVFDGLRHALAHAGVIYLDEEGYYRPANQARMLAFISEDRNPNPYMVLGIMEEDFSRFLRGWAAWLGELGVNDIALGA